mmetsp:Transcript_22883/g.67561  ORF Transcript_22883/g.67561 Transcript_22883/m.67561 type:complete len:218 (+) Transcript_22883:673-1326(+)
MVVAAAARAEIDTETTAAVAEPEPVMIPVASSETLRFFSTGPPLSALSSSFSFTLSPGPRLLSPLLSSLSSGRFSSPSSCFTFSEAASSRSSFIFFSFSAAAASAAEAAAAARPRAIEAAHDIKVLLRRARSLSTRLMSMGNNSEPTRPYDSRTDSAEHRYAISSASVTLVISSSNSSHCDKEEVVSRGPMRGEIWGDKAAPFFPEGRPPRPPCCCC